MLFYFYYCFLYVLIFSLKTNIADLDHFQSDPPLSVAEKMYFVKKQVERHDGSLVEKPIYVQQCPLPDIPPCCSGLPTCSGLPPCSESPLNS